VRLLAGHDVTDPLGAFESLPVLLASLSAASAAAAVDATAVQEQQQGDQAGAEAAAAAAAAARCWQLGRATASAAAASNGGWSTRSWRRYCSRASELSQHAQELQRAETVYFSKSTNQPMYSCCAASDVNGVLTIRAIWK
jgi:hypothetical protein